MKLKIICLFCIVITSYDYYYYYYLIVAKSVCMFQLPFMLSAASLFWEII